MATKKPPKAALVFIFITVVLDSIGLGIIIPVIPALIMELTAEGIGKAAEYGGWLMFVYAFMQFVFAPIVGGLSDRFGRRPILLSSMAGFVVDYLIVGFATSISWLFAARIFAGVFGASHTTATAYIADISTPEKRAQNFGLIGAAFGLGFILGPVIGGLLGEYGARVPFFASAILAFINLLYGFFILPESLSAENRRVFDWKRANPLGALIQIKRFPGISALVVVYFLLYLSHHSTQSTWTYFTMFQFDWDEAMVGFSLGIVGICIALVQGGLTRIVIPKFGEFKAVYIGLLFYIFGFLGFAFAPSSWVFLMVIAPFTLGGFSGPALQGIISNEVDNNEQGELQGALTSVISLTAIIGPPMMTGLFSFFTSSSAPIQIPGAAFIAGAILCILALCGAAVALKKTPL
jgi:DHA1 family tetracycline resistance protein-like MFS transporter